MAATTMMIVEAWQLGLRRSLAPLGRLHNLHNPDAPVTLPAGSGPSRLGPLRRRQQMPRRMLRRRPRGSGPPCHRRSCWLPPRKPAARWGPRCPCTRLPSPTPLAARAKLAALDKCHPFSGGGGWAAGFNAHQGSVNCQHKRGACWNIRNPLLASTAGDAGKPAPPRRKGLLTARRWLRRRRLPRRRRQRRSWWDRRRPTWWQRPSSLAPTCAPPRSCASAGAPPGPHPRQRELDGS